MKYDIEPSAVGVFEDLEKAERSIDELQRAGFHVEEIGIIGNVGQDETTVPTPRELHAPEENAIGGFLSGNVLGAIVGTLVILVIPGLSQVTGTGPWFEIIGGAALGAIVGGVLIAFSSLVFNRPRTRLYAAELERGRFIVTVRNPARKDEAVRVLRHQGLHAEED